MDPCVIPTHTIHRLRDDSHIVKSYMYISGIQLKNIKCLRYKSILQSGENLVWVLPLQNTDKLSLTHDLDILQRIIIAVTSVCTAHCESSVFLASSTWTLFINSLRACIKQFFGSWPCNADKWCYVQRINQPHSFT